MEIDVQGRLSENVTLYTKVRGYAANPQDDFLRHYDYFGNASIANGVTTLNWNFGGGVAAECSETRL